MTSTDVATTINKPPIVVLRERLETRKGELRKALPDDVAPDQFIRAVVTSATINPDLQACTFQSLWLACLRACRDGLLPDGRQGAIVPFKSQATWIPMVQGLLVRFRRSGQFKWITAGLVREGEEFQHYIDEAGEHFYHKPGDDFAAAILKVYALATTKDGGVFCTVLPIAEANKIRNTSRAKDGPWRDWAEEMYKKTALRRLCKVLPSGDDLMPEEQQDELPDREPATPIAAAPIARITGTAAALDQFAGEPRTVQDEGRRTTAVDPADSQEPEPAGPSGRALAGDAGSAPGENASPIDRVLAAAWQRGADDHSKGVQRKAVPPEWRTPDRGAEALAWAKGWVGEPL